MTADHIFIHNTSNITCDSALRIQKGMDIPVRYQVADPHNANYGDYSPSLLLDIIFIAILVVFIIFIGKGIKKTWLQTLLQHLGVRLSALILDIFPSPSGGETAGPVFIFIIYYSYKVDEKNYTGNAIISGDKIKNYTIGEEITIYYNPKKPWQSTWEKPS